ncbi:MAG TPA: hypothetical protein VN958_04530, partial [Chitinophagaceae bacterium]|nr:hypothetical protein [Chitinophagaceae bacterium]
PPSNLKQSIIKIENCHDSFSAHGDNIAKKLAAKKVVTQEYFCPPHSCGSCRDCYWLIAFYILMMVHIMVKFFLPV